MDMGNMNTAMKADRLIVDCIPMGESERKRLVQAAGDVPIVFNDRSDLAGSMHVDMEVPEEYKSRVTAVLGNISPDVAAGLPHLEWLQTASAGVDRYVDPGVLDASASLTNASGAYGQAVGEHMFGMMWAVMKNIPRYIRQQVVQDWHEGEDVQSPLGRRVLVLGTGDIGSYFAGLAKSVGMRTDGVRRDVNKSAEHIDTMHGFDALDELLPLADVVAMSLPSSPQTRHIIDARRLSLMKSSAIVLNVGRGDGIDCDALADALARGVIRGAGIDVTDPEPLPKGHPLWDDPRCLITPHIAGGNHLAGTSARIANIVIENVRRYVAQEPLDNLIVR